MNKTSILLTAFIAFRLFTASAHTPREWLSLNEGWRFQSADVADGEKAGTDDSHWEQVTLPHNWGWQDAQQGKKNYRGPGWYRRALDMPKESGKRYFLKFDAASLVANVYLNGTLIGEHRGGFGAFCFEITRGLSDAGTNLLAVRVDNSRFPDIAPLDGDFSIYGGLYRPVHLITPGEENFSPTDHGSPGVVWRQTSVTQTQAVLDVTVQISTDRAKRSSLKLSAIIQDPDGKTVVTTESDIKVAPRDTAPYYLDLKIPQPHLWSGRPDPYLYRAIVELRTTNDVVLDRVEQPLGLRYYLIDPDRGFFLNGKPYHLHGVNRHQDFMNQGWAISEADMDTDISLLKEIGATVVRCAHYQHSDYFYNLCDRAGILVWAEIPQVNIVRDTPEFENTSRNQLLDLIRQNENHPSIFTWSLGNEIGSKSDDPHRELQDLAAVAQGEDPTRPTIEATMTDARPQMNRITDLLGWNIYPGWYSGDKNDYGRMLDARRYSSRNGGFSVSEYGAGANPAQHEQNSRGCPR